MSQKKRSNGILSFKFAFEGIHAAFKTESNFKFHLLIALLVIAAGFYFKISTNDWTKITVLIGLVITLELTNTAIEAIVNSFTTKTHPGAKLAKDIAAGAVLVAAITAAVTGVLVFLPYIK